MLPSSVRLRRRPEFDAAARSGRRAGASRLVGHLLVDADATHRPRVGFVVGRTVGGAVERNRVRRRLRHLMRARLAALPAGALFVVRALPKAAHSSYTELAEDLDAVLRRLGVGADLAGSGSGDARPQSAPTSQSGTTAVR